MKLSAEDEERSQRIGKEYERLIRIYGEPHKLGPVRCLDLLLSICQTIGKIEVAASRCDYDGKLGKERWDQHAAFSNFRADLSSEIRHALMAPELKKLWASSEP